MSAAALLIPDCGCCARGPACNDKFLESYNVALDLTGYVLAWGSQICPCSGYNDTYVLSINTETQYDCEWRWDNSSADPCKHSFDPPQGPVDEFIILQWHDNGDGTAFWWATCRFGAGQETNGFYVNQCRFCFTSGNVAGDLGPDEVTFTLSASSPYLCPNNPYPNWNGSTFVVS